jgi:hypothetical protein
LGRFFPALLAAVAVISFCVPAANAQYRASLRGTVTDPQGAVLPGAKLTLTNAASGEQLLATSDGSGIYTFNGLPPAHFRLTVEHAGFNQKVIEDVSIIPEQLNALDVQMKVGTAEQTVTVSGTTQALDVDTATTSATVDSNQIQHLPSFNRDVFQLAQLAPGVFGDGSQTSGQNGGGANNLPGNQGPGGTSGGSGGIFQTENGPQIQARGGQYENNGITIDGVSTTSAVWGGTSIVTPSEDSIESVKVTSSTYDAEYGRFSGAQIEVTSKSGGNTFHGSGFFKASRPGLNAYQRWNGAGSNQAGTAAERGVNRDNNRFNNYGGSLGGPIWKDRIFAFFNVETSPLSTPGISQGWYDTSQFDSSAAPSNSTAAKFLTYKGEGVSATGIISRTCASVGLTEGVNCATTSGGLDLGSPLKTGLGLQDLSYGGGSGTPGIGSGLDGIPDLAFFNTTTPTTISQTQYNGRLDGNPTKKDLLSFAIYWVPSSNTAYNGPSRPANLWHHSQINDAFTVIWNHTFSPTLLNQARVNAAGWRWNEVGTNPQAPFGLPEANIDSPGSVPSVENFGAPGPSNLNQWTYTYKDVLTKVLGRESIKVGGELTRLYYLNNPVYAARPSYNFHNLWDFANDAPYFESGQFNSATGVPFANRQDDRVNLWGFFIQDDIKLRPNLTVNAGLRWSYYGSFYSKENNLDVLRLGSGANVLTDLNIRVGGPLYNPQKSNYGPQLGFAWQPRSYEGKLVVRGGFGVGYNQNEIAITANGNGNPPNAVQANYTCPYPFTANPSCANTGILYETATDVHSLFGYAPNPSTITKFSSANLPLSGPAFVTGFPANPKSIVNYHFSLDTEYQLAFNSVFTLAYQGSLTRHSLIQYEYNSVAAAHGLALNPSANFVDFYDNAGNGNFNALITTLTHNFAHGFQAEAQYTFAKAMDENSGPYSEDPYPYNSHLAYARSDYNVANAFKLFGLWQPVLFHGNQQWLEKVAGGWSLSGIWNVHSGFPWNPVYNIVGDAYYQGSPYSQLRPAAVVGSPSRSTANSVFKANISPNYGGDGTKFFVAPTYPNGADFPNTSPAPPPGIQRNSLNGPGYNDLDGSLSKAFGVPSNRILGENAKFEIRGDFYNLFNKTNVNGGQINNVIGTANPDGSIVPNSVASNFGTANQALASRVIQLQARFSF